MSPKKLTAWLNTAESKKVGHKATDGSESVHARKVVGYIHRHLAQRLAGDITCTPWSYSLMNWEHDPLAGR